ncbi:MAG: response regulator [Deltaproteobacteria bacterium]|nr:response regulator [Deltaproteobacteria bacterium]
MPKKILIVDDKTSIVVPLKFLLKRNGYKVMGVFNGEEAVKTISNFRPDLILLDVKHAGIDGFEICRIVRENAEWKSIKIVFLTAMARDVDIAKGFAFGADAYIIKPFSNSEILQEVGELLKGS